MLHLPLDPVTRDALWDALLDSTQIRVDVGIHDPQEKRVSSFDFAEGSSQLESGSVTVDTTQDVSRSLELELFDDRQRFAFEPDSPAHGAIFTGYFVSVQYEIYVPPFGAWPHPESYPETTSYPGATDLSADSGLWIEAPVFWGPLTAYEQLGPEIKIEAQGKEARALAPHYATKGYTVHEHEHTDDAIKNVMRRVGEDRFDIPDLPWRVKHDRPVHPQSEPWKVVAGGEEDHNGNPIAGLIERTGAHPFYLYYDARGYLRAKHLNKQPVFTFDGHTMTTPATTNLDALNFYNAVDVTGGKPKGKGKKRAHALVELPADNPMSPHALRRRNGAKTYVTKFIQAPNLKTDRACRQRGLHVLRQAHTSLEVSFDALPIPMLEEMDVVRVETEEFGLVTVPLKQFTLPLDASSDMTIGDTKRVRRKHKGGSGGEAGPGGPGSHGGHVPGRTHHGPHRRQHKRSRGSS